MDQHKTREERTARQRRAARSNGRKGGRPRMDRHFEDFAGVDTPPCHPVELGHWVQHVVAIDIKRIEDGRALQALSQEIRAYATTISKILHPVILMAGADPGSDWWREPPEEPPSSDQPVAMAHWILWRLAVNLCRCVRGQEHSGAELRASVNGYVKAIPPDVLYESRRLVTEQVKDLDTPPGPALRPTAEPIHGHEEYYRTSHC